MWNKFVGGVYLIILTEEVVNKFDFFFPRIIFSFKRALEHVKYFLNIVFVVSYEKDDGKSRLTDDELRNLLLRLLYHFYSFSCSISLDPNLKHLKIQVFPLVVPLSGALSENQRNVFLHFFSTKRVEFYEECGQTKEIGLFYCMPARPIVNPSFSQNNFEWSVISKIKSTISKTLVFFIELPCLVCEKKCHFQLTPPELHDLKFHETTVVGGTFDQLHEGHQLLVNAAALLAKKKTVICIVQDDSILLKNKSFSWLLLPCMYRVKKLYRYILRFLCLIGEPRENVVLSKELMKCCLMNTRLAENELIEMVDVVSSTTDINLSATKGSSRLLTNSLMGDFIIKSSILTKLSCDTKKSIEFLPLKDAVGPAANRSDFTCLIVTPDTQKGALSVNYQRKVNGLNEVDIVTLPFIEPLIFVELLVPKSVSLPDTNVCTRHILNQAETPKKQLSIQMTQGQNVIYYNNETIPKALSSTQLRETLNFHSQTSQLYSWWLFLGTIINIPQNISFIWGQCLLCRMLNVPWREKTLRFLKKSMNFYYKKTMRVQCALREQSLICICLWFFCLVDTLFFDDLLFNKNTLALHCEMVVRTLNKIIESFCNDLFWFSDKQVQHHWRSLSSYPNNPCRLEDFKCFLSNCICLHTSTLRSSTRLTLNKYATSGGVLNIMDLHKNLSHVVNCMVNQAWSKKISLSTPSNISDIRVPNICPAWPPFSVIVYFEKLYPHQEISLIVSSLINDSNVKEILNDHARDLVCLMHCDLFRNFDDSKMFTAWML